MICLGRYSFVFEESVLSYERDKGKFYLSVSPLLFFFFSFFLLLLKIGDKEF